MSRRSLLGHHGGLAVAFLRGGASASHRLPRSTARANMARASSAWPRRPACRLYSFDPAAALSTTDKSAAGAAELCDRKLLYKLVLVHI
jgi:hypothetical protein|eukprot:COSAG02_NODE_316_length_24889_cov_9.418556_13_plen_89_part_00